VWIEDVDSADVAEFARGHHFQHVAVRWCAARHLTVYEVVFLREQHDVRCLGENVDEIAEVQPVPFFTDLTLAETPLDVLETNRQPADVDRRDNTLGGGRAARPRRLGRLRRGHLGPANQGHSQQYNRRAGETVEIHVS